MMATKALSQYDVHETPGVAGGYPCVGNTRIPVRVIVEHVQDALAYYEDYPARVDEDIRTNAEAFAALQRR
jgi:uncharacterized protein (DUF433 family)